MKRLFQFSSNFLSSITSSEGVYYSQYGNPLDVLEWGECPSTTIIEEGKGVRVKMIASAINPSDINMIEGTYGVLPDYLPYIGGNEGLGIVEETEENVNNFKKGDFVIVVDSRVGGTWVVENIFEEDNLFKIPLEIHLGKEDAETGSISAELASTIKVNPVAAWRMLHDFCDLQPGDSIIINSANSQVGRSALQIGKAMGLTTIGVLRDRPNWEEYCDGILGADLLIREDDVASDLLKSEFLKENRPRLALNGVGGDSAANLLRALGPSGTMVTYGGMSRKPVVCGTGSFIFKDISLRGFWLDRATKEEKIDGLNGVLDLVGDGKFKNSSYNKFLFCEDQFFEALNNYYDRTFTDGKMVMIMDEKYL